MMRYNSQNYLTVKAVHMLVLKSLVELGHWM